MSGITAIEFSVGGNFSRPREHLFCYLYLIVSFGLHYGNIDLVGLNMSHYTLYPTYYWALRPEVSYILLESFGVGTLCFGDFTPCSVNELIIIRVCESL